MKNVNKCEKIEIFSNVILPLNLGLKSFIHINLIPTNATKINLKNKGRT